jgi:hypothetical protein
MNESTVLPVQRAAALARLPALVLTSTVLLWTLRFVPRYLGESGRVFG